MDNPLMAGITPPSTPTQTSGGNPLLTGLTPSTVTKSTNNVNPLLSGVGGPQPVASPTFKPTVGGFFNDFWNNLPDTIQKFFPSVLPASKSMNDDLLNLKPTTQGTGIVDFGKKLVSDTVGTVVGATKDALDSISEFMGTKGATVNDKGISVLKPDNRRTSQQIASGLNVVSKTAGVAFSPISALFKGAEEFPVLGTLAKGLSLPFGAVGDVGTEAFVAGVNHLPIPEQDKANLRDAAGQIGALAAQLLLGKAFEDVVTDNKVAQLQKQFGTEGANTIVDIVKQKAGLIPQGEIPNTPKVTGEGIAAPEAPLTPEELQQKQGGFINPEAAMDSAKAALENIKAGNESKKFGSDLRTFFTGTRDVSVADTNQFFDSIERLIPNEADRQTIYWMRDFANNEAGLHEMIDKFKASEDSNLQEHVPAMEAALNPSPEMETANKAITNYFSEKLKVGQEKGFLDSSITPEEYVKHILRPAEEEGVPAKKGPFGSKIGRKFDSAQGRFYENTGEAMLQGVMPKTTDVSQIGKVYGDKFATSAATHDLIDVLKKTEMGKWGFKSSENVPKDWVELAPGKELFRNRLPYIDKASGEAAVATQNLYVPEKVADALKAIIEPSSLSNLPGFRRARAYGAIIKAGELGLSFFHDKALSLTALNNMGPDGIAKALMSDMKSEDFMAKEKEAIRAGMTSPVLGRTIEAYRGLQDVLPSRLDMIKDLPGIKQLDSLAKANTKFTFDILQRKFKVVDFSLKDTAWLDKHPEATPAEHYDAQKAIAKESNATYGGLQWENLGVNKTVLDVAKILILAPDWTFSNFLNAKYAFEGGPAGNAARMFWLRTFITGYGMTQGMSALLGKKIETNPSKPGFWSVYMGKDKNGKEIYTNMFYVGAPNDLINLANYTSDYGLGAGFGQFLAAKGSPYVKTGTEFLTNKDYLGKDIAPKGSGPIVGTARTAGEAAKNLTPIPFLASNIYSMLTDPKKQYTLPEYLAVIAGTKPRHVVPAGEREVTSGKHKGDLVPANEKTKKPILEQIKTGQIYEPSRKQKR